MLSDCYFYLGYINKENFIRIKDTIDRNPDLFHILKVAFDVEADPNLLSQQVELIQKVLQWAFLAAFLVRNFLSLCTKVLK